MISGCAVSASVTDARIAKGLTFLASEATARSKVTDFIGGTLVVAATTCCNTSNQRIALQTRRANTDGSVKVYLAFSLVATLSGQARIHTFL